MAPRREFRLPGYATLSDVGMDGDYVSPLQITSRSPTGPVLVAYHWLDASAITEENRATLQALGYLPTIPFNRVLDRALALCGLRRPDVYLTQAFHLLPQKRSERVPADKVAASFGAITMHEVQGRRVVALGRDAAAACRRHGVKHIPADHPSARGRSYEERAAALAAAIVYAIS